MRVSSLYWGYRSRQIDRNFGRRQICNVEKAALQISCESEMQGQTTNVDYRPWSLVLVFLFRLLCPSLPYPPTLPSVSAGGTGHGRMLPICQLLSNGTRHGDVCHFSETSWNWNTLSILKEKQFLSLRHESPALYCLFVSNDCPDKNARYLSYCPFSDILKCIHSTSYRHCKLAFRPWEQT